MRQFLACCYFMLIIALVVIAMQLSSPISLCIYLVAALMICAGPMLARWGLKAE